MHQSVTNNEAPIRVNSDTNLHSIIKTLATASQSIECQSEVSQVLNSMICDIELAYHVTAQVEQEQKQLILEEKYRHVKMALDEHRAVSLESMKRNQLLAIDFAKDIVALSVKLGELQEWKVENLDKVNKYHEMEEMYLRLEKQEKNEICQTSLKDNDKSDMPSVKKICSTDVALDPSKSIENDTSAMVDQALSSEIEEILTSKEIQIQHPSLESIDETLLIKIFEFSEAIDILELAQTNQSMYSKIDHIFNLGGTVASDENEEEQVKDSSDSTTLGDVSVTNPKVTLDPDDTVKPPPPTTTTTTTPNQSLKNVESSNPNLLSPNPSSLDKNDKPLPKQKDNQISPFQMNSSIANSLASKLNAVELAAIISMRDEVRKRDEELFLIRSESDETKSKYDGIVAVKNLLAKKVEELHKLLEESRENVIKIISQNSSDQEVIAFLDEQVQDLESTVGRLQLEKDTAIDKAAKVTSTTEKQMKVLTDMLAFEREQAADNEKEWKSTKKLLVKEVKNCRAHILTLEAERDGYLAENAKLKQALLSLGAKSSK